MKEGGANVQYAWRLKKKKEEEENLPVSWGMEKLVSVVELWPLNAAASIETSRWPHWPLLYVDFWARWITWSSILQTGYGITQKEKIQFLLTDRLLNLRSCSVPFCTNSQQHSQSSWTGRPRRQATGAFQDRKGAVLLSEDFDRWIRKATKIRQTKPVKTPPPQQMAQKCLDPFDVWQTWNRQKHLNISCEDEQSDCNNEVCVNDCT